MGDNERFYAAVRRMVRAAYKRAASGDPEELADLGDLTTFCANLERACIKLFREEGYTWEHIGSVYGLSRQAAFNRWGSK